MRLLSGALAAILQWFPRCWKVRVDSLPKQKKRYVHPVYSIYGIFIWVNYNISLTWIKAHELSSALPQAARREDCLPLRCLSLKLWNMSQNHPLNLLPESKNQPWHGAQEFLSNFGWLNKRYQTKLNYPPPSSARAFRTVIMRSFPNRLRSFQSDGNMVSALLKLKLGAVWNLPLVSLTCWWIKLATSAWLGKTGLMCRPWVNLPAPCK